MTVPETVIVPAVLNVNLLLIVPPPALDHVPVPFITILALPEVITVVVTAILPPTLILNAPLMTEVVAPLNVRFPDKFRSDESV